MEYILMGVCYMEETVWQGRHAKRFRIVAPGAAKLTALKENGSSDARTMSSALSAFTGQNIPGVDLCGERYAERCGRYGLFGHERHRGVVLQNRSGCTADADIGHRDVGLFPMQRTYLDDHRPAESAAVPGRKMAENIILQTKSPVIISETGAESKCSTPPYDITNM